MSSTKLGFLHRVLLADGAVSGLTGLGLALGANALGPVTGLSPELLRGAGLVLVPFAALVLWLGTRERPPVGGVRLVIGLNLAWVLASAGLLISGVASPTGLGYGFVIAQALAVLALAEFQMMGLRRSVGLPVG